MAELLRNQIVQFPGCLVTRASLCRTFETNFTLSFLTLRFVSTCAVPHDTHNLTFRLSLANGLEQPHTPWGDTASPSIAGIWEMHSRKMSLLQSRVLPSDSWRCATTCPGTVQTKVSFPHTVTGPASDRTSVHTCLQWKTLLLVKLRVAHTLPRS